MNDLSPSHDTLERQLDAIETKTRNKIDVYLSARGKSHIHEDARGLSQNVSDDYGNRFLIELIQNAHDAHPADKQDGEIAVVFVAEGDTEFGCLYVANRGTYYYEVKASQGDPGSFHFGPTEIVAAGRYREDQDHIYRVLYVSHATERAWTRIRLLPNPLSDEGRRKLNPVGRGAVTYAFDPSSKDETGRATLTAARSRVRAGERAVTAGSRVYCRIGRGSYQKRLT